MTQYLIACAILLSTAACAAPVPTTSQPPRTPTVSWQRSWVGTTSSGRHRNYRAYQMRESYGEVQDDQDLGPALDKLDHIDAELRRLRDRMSKQP